MKKTIISWTIQLTKGPKFENIRWESNHRWKKKHPLILSNHHSKMRTIHLVDLPIIWDYSPCPKHVYKSERNKTLNTNWLWSNHLTWDHITCWSHDLNQSPIPELILNHVCLNMLMHPLQSKVCTYSRGKYLATSFVVPSPFPNTYKKTPTNWISLQLLEGSQMFSAVLFQTLPQIKM